MSRRILILSASVGAGHMRAAEAVELALRQLDPAATIRSLDVLTLTNATFRRLYGRAYLDLVNRAPHVLGYFYDMLDKAPSPRRKSDRLRALVDRANLGRLVALLEDESWDCIVNTHFLPAEIIAGLRAKRRIGTPQFTVTTDFETHRLWVNQPCEQYFTATQEGALHLEHWGVPGESISVTGIPIHPVFSRPKGREECRARHGLRDDRPVILLLAGGFGVGPIERYYGAILEIERALQAVVVCGRNEKLRARLERVSPPPRHRAAILGYTNQMDELMRAADVVATKPGGLTTSEVLACGAAMAIINPIPGQESRNSDFLLENGAAIKINNLSTFGYKISRLLEDTARLSQLQSASRRLGRPEAAFGVARHIVETSAEPGARTGKSSDRDAKRGL